MKHRSVIAFVLLAAILAAVPQASQDLLELKNALGERVRSEIWHAFLSLNERGGAVQTAQRPTQQPTVASCSAPTSPGAKKSSAPARATSAQVGAAAAVETARSFETEELAMMLTPPAHVEEKLEVEVTEELKGLMMGKVLKAPAPAPLSAQEMAMIIPPSEGADPVPTRGVAATKAREALAHSRRAEVESRVSYVATAFDGRGIEFRKVGDLMRFQFNNSLKDGATIPPPSVAPKAKVTKVRRQQTLKSVTAPVAAPTGLAKHLACLGAEPDGMNALAATE